MLPLIKVRSQCLNFPWTCLDEHLCSQDRMRLRGSNINKTYSGCVCVCAVPGLCWRTRTGGWWTPRWPGDLLLTVSHMLPLVTAVRCAAASWLLLVSSSPPGAARDLPAGGWAVAGPGAVAHTFMCHRQQLTLNMIVIICWTLYPAIYNLQKLTDEDGR